MSDNTIVIYDQDGTATVVYAGVKGDPGTGVPVPETNSENDGIITYQLSPGVPGFRFIPFAVVPFETDQGYAIGRFVTYDSNIWICVVAADPGGWDPAEWRQLTFYDPGYADPYIPRIVTQRVVSSYSSSDYIDFINGGSWDIELRSKVHIQDELQVPRIIGTSNVVEVESNDIYLTNNAPTSSIHLRSQGEVKIHDPAGANAPSLVVDASDIAIQAETTTTISSTDGKITINSTNADAAVIADNGNVVIDSPNGHVLINGIDAREDRFVGAWEPGMYHLGNIVNDNDYLMKCIVESTEERAAPQPQGEAVWKSGLGDTPGFALEERPTDSVVIAGQRYRFTVPKIMQAIRVNNVDGDPNQRYDIYIVRNATGGNPRSTQMGSFIGLPQGWSTVTVMDDLIPADEDIDVFMFITNHSSGSQVDTYQWNYLRTNSLPGGGVITHSNNGRDLTINYIDDGGTDRSAVISQLEVGDTIKAEGILWTITVANAPDIIYRSFEVQPTTRIGSDGLYNFELTRYADAVIKYGEIVDHYLGDNEVKGFITFTAYKDIEIGDYNDTAYNIDILIGDVAASADWQFMLKGK